MEVLFSMLSTASRASFWMPWINSEISLVDWVDFSASLRTSSATTANPRPCSPARAASIAAFKASRVVCSAGSAVASMIFSNVVGALSQGADDLARRGDGGVDAVEAVGGLLHGANAVVHFLARAVGDVEQNLCCIGNALNRRYHLIYGGGSFADAGSLHLRALHHVLHVDTHLMHGAGDFVDRRGSLQAHLGRIVGCAGHLIGSAGDLRGGVANAAHQPGQAFHHASEGIT